MGDRQPKKGIISMRHSLSFNYDCDITKEMTFQLYLFVFN